MLDSNVLFYLFTISLIICAFMVIVAQHSVFSLLFLIGSFLFSACLLFIFECEFLALIFVVIYVGAIAALFLFTIMMLESKFTNLSENSIKYLPISFFFSLIILFPLLGEISVNFKTNTYCNNICLSKNQDWFSLIDSTTKFILSYSDIMKLLTEILPQVTLYPGRLIILADLAIITIIAILVGIWRNRAKSRTAKIAIAKKIALIAWLIAIALAATLIYWDSGVAVIIWSIWSIVDLTTINIILNLWDHNFSGAWFIPASLAALLYGYLMYDVFSFIFSR